MTGSAVSFSGARPAVTAVAVGVAALVVLAAGLTFAPVPVAQGWLMAFLFWSSIPVGSLVLLLIHQLVGGRWGDALAPVLLPAAGLMPLVALAFVLVALGSAANFPWVSQPGILPPGVGRFYLNLPGFLLRAVVALGGWSILAVLLAKGRCTKLAAGLGLAFHGLIISFVAIDWILSIEPHFVSTAFAAGFAIQQILAALAWAALSAPEASDDPATGDVGAFLMAALLGVVYLALMSYIVAWYGDLPEKAAWYLRRGTDGWSWTITAAIAIGAIIPFAMLLRRSLRRSRRALRVVAGLILLGIWLHVAWLVAPAFRPGWLIAALAALVAMTSLSLGLMRTAALQSARSAAHVG